MINSKGRNIVGKIFCLMGKSSSGKDTIFKAILHDCELNLYPIIPYTTRPIRHNEKQGREYYFVDESTLESYRAMGKIIEQRDYNTVNGIWSYCTIDDGQIKLHEANYLIITTLEAYKNLQNYFGVAYVIPIYVYVEDGVRLQRALDREKKQTYPNYEELCRRFLADNMDFSFEKLTALGVTVSYTNEDLKACIVNIKADILKEINDSL